MTTIIDLTYDIYPILIRIENNEIGDLDNLYTDLAKSFDDQMEKRRNDNSKMNYLSESRLKLFETKQFMLSSNDGISMESKNKLAILIEDLIGYLEMLGESSEFKKYESEPIKLEVEYSMLLALFDICRKNGFFKASNARIGKLFEENFIQKNKREIKAETVSQRYYEGISNQQYEKSIQLISGK